MLGDVSSIFDIKQAASGEMEILRSRLVVGHAVDYYQLYVHATPDYFPVIGRWLAKRHESFALPTAVTDAIPGGWAPGRRAHPGQPHRRAGRPDRQEAAGGGAGRWRLRIGRSGARPALRRPCRAVGNTSKCPAARSKCGIDALQAGRRPALRRGAELAWKPSNRCTGPRIGHLRARGQVNVIGVTLRGRGSGADGGRAERNQPGIRAARIPIARPREAEKSWAYLDPAAAGTEEAAGKIGKPLPRPANSRGTIDLTEERKLVLGQSVEAQSKIFELKARRQELVTRFAASHPSDCRHRPPDHPSLTSDMNKLNSKIRDCPTWNRTWCG